MKKTLLILCLSLPIMSLALGCNGVLITLNKESIRNPSRMPITDGVGGGNILKHSIFSQIDNHNYCLSHCISTSIDCVSHVEFNTSSAQNSAWNITTNFSNASDRMKATININGVDRTPAACSYPILRSCHITY